MERNAKVNPEEFTFGIEIECAVPYAACRENCLTPGGYHRGTQQAAFIHAGLGDWLIQSDSSLHFNGNVSPMEVTSPIMRGADGVAQTIKMLELLKSWGAKVNSSCGLHVTVGHPRFSEDFTLAQLVLTMFRFSDALVAIGASFGRRSRNYSASLLQLYGTDHDRKAAVSDAHFCNRFIGNRYQALNLCHAKLGNRVEFRLFAGTLNPNRMLAAIWSSIGVCQYAMSVSKLHTAVVSDFAHYCNKTYYQKNLEHTLHLLGWGTLGKRPMFWSTKLGVMMPDGMPAETFDKVMRQVRKDAKRMDEANANSGYRARVRRPQRRQNPPAGA